MLYDILLQIASACTKNVWFFGLYGMFSFILLLYVSFIYMSVEECDGGRAPGSLRKKTFPSRFVQRQSSVNIKLPSEFPRASACPIYSHTQFRVVFRIYGRIAYRRRRNVQECGSLRFISQSHDYGRGEAEHLIISLT
jgi:hypothetical protein